MRTRQGNRRRSGGRVAGTSQPGCGGMSQLPTCQHGHNTGHLGWAVVLIFHLNVTAEAGGRGLSGAPLSQPLDLCLGSSALLQSFGLIWASNPKIKFEPSDGKIDHLDRLPPTTVPAAVTNQSLAGCHRERSGGRTPGEGLPWALGVSHRLPSWRLQVSFCLSSELGGQTPAPVRARGCSGQGYTAQFLSRV